MYSTFTEKLLGIANMRILRTHPFIPPLPGGMENHVYKLTLAQRAAGHDVSLYFNQGKSEHLDDKKILTFLNLRKVRPVFLRNFLFYSVAIFRLLMIGRKYNVVHIHGDWSALLFGLFLKTACKADVLTGSIHDKIPSGRGWNKIHALILKRYDVIYTTGKDESKILSNLLDKTVFWQNSGIDDLFFVGSSNFEAARHIDVCSVSSFLPKKNHAFQLALAKKMPNIKFMLIGDGPLLKSMREICRAQRIENISFTGELPLEKVAFFLRQSKIFLSTSYAEGTPTALLEAMACGNLIITSASNDYSDFLNNGENGIIIEEFDLGTYESSVKTMLRQYNLKQSMVDKNRERSKQFSWPRVSEKITAWMEGSNRAKAM